MQPTGGVLKNSRHKSFENCTEKIWVAESFSVIIHDKVRYALQMKLHVKFSE